jgi:hypothetical protein
MDDWPQRHVGNAECEGLFRVAVHHRLDIGPRLIDGTVDEALEVRRAVVMADHFAVECKLHNISLSHQFGAA